MYVHDPNSCDSPDCPICLRLKLEAKDKEIKTLQSKYDHSAEVTADLLADKDKEIEELKENQCDDCLELAHGDAIVTMTKLKADLKAKDKEIEELNLLLEVSRNDVDHLRGEVSKMEKQLEEEKVKEFEMFIEDFEMVDEYKRWKELGPAFPKEQYKPLDKAEEKKPKCPINECDGEKHPLNWIDVSCREYFDCWYDKTDKTDKPEEKGEEDQSS